MYSAKIKVMTIGKISNLYDKSLLGNRCYFINHQKLRFLSEENKFVHMPLSLNSKLTQKVWWYAGFTDSLTPTLSLTHTSQHSDSLTHNLIHSHRHLLTPPITQYSITHTHSQSHSLKISLTHLIT